jgi:transposase
MARPSSYPPELRKRAVRMVAGIRGGYPTESAAINAVVAKLGIGTRETLRKWIRQDQIDTGQRPGTTTEESAQIKALNIYTHLWPGSEERTRAAVDKAYADRPEEGEQRADEAA